MDAPWRVVTEEDDAVLLRLGDSPDGVRVNLLPGDRHRVIGVTPVIAGRTLEVEQDGERWPLVAVGYPDEPVSKVTIEVTGVDLVVRFEGPALDTLTAHPEAPADPAITWVRLRPRGQDWRIVMDGLGTLSLPADDLRIEPADGATVAIDAAWGDLVLESDAPRLSSAIEGARWWASTRPSLEVYEPYKRIAFTWTP